MAVLQASYAVLHRVSDVAYADVTAGHPARGGGRFFRSAWLVQDHS